MRIITSLKNTKDNYFGKKDENTKESLTTQYNDQLIWNEIINFSKKEQIDINFLTNDQKDFKNDSNLKLKMIEDFYCLTDKKLEIMSLKEFPLINAIEKDFFNANKLELIVKENFLKIKTIDEIIDDGIEFIEENYHDISETLQSNREILDELFEDDCEEGDEYILAINALQLQIGSYSDFNEIDLECTLTKLENGVAIFNIVVILNVGGDVNSIFTYKLKVDKNMENLLFLLDSISFDTNGPVYWVKDEKELNKILLEKFNFFNTIKPIM